MIQCIVSRKDPNDKYSISSEPRRIATIINKHFSSVGPNLANKLPPAQHSYLDFLNVSNTLVTSFAFELVIPDEVKQEISSIPNGKSHGLWQVFGECYKQYSCTNNKFIHIDRSLS